MSLASSGRLVPQTLRHDGKDLTPSVGRCGNPVAVREMLQMSARFGEGGAAHKPGKGSPAPGPGRLGRHLPGRRRAISAQDLDYLVASPFMMREQHAYPARDAIEAVLVGRQGFGTVVRCDGLERAQIGGERRLGRVRLQPDVRADSRQHVIAGEQEILRFVVQAQVPRRVPWRPHRARDMLTAPGTC